MKFTLEKSGLVVDDSDGVLTSFGMSVAQTYAEQWVTGKRDTLLEGTYPTLRGLFYDIRNDHDLARDHALPLAKSLASAPLLVLPLS